MQQVKIFKSLESDVTDLERQVNAWIRQSRARITSITGNIAPQTETHDAKSAALGKGAFPPSDVMLIVLYEEPEENL